MKTTWLSLLGIACWAAAWIGTLYVAGDFLMRVW